MAEAKSKGRTMRRVLLVANHAAMNKNMLRWAHILKRDGLWEPLVFSVSGDLGPLVDDMRIAQDVPILYAPPGLGWVHHLAGAKAPAEAAAGAPARTASGDGGLRARIIGPLRDFGWWGAVRSVLSIFRAVRTIRRQIHYLRAFLAENGIDAILLSESSPAYGAPVFFRAAGHAGIPVVTVPIDHYGTRDHADMYRTETSLHVRGGLNRVAAFLCPKWVVDVQELRILRIPAEQVLAQEIAGIASPEPWRMVGAWEDGIATAGRAMRDFFVGEGVQERRLHVVGNPELDLMAMARERGRGERHENLVAGDRRPIILTALVADHFLSGRSEAEYQSFDAIVEAWVRPLGAIANHQVIVGLHPSQRYEDFRYIEQWGVKIYRGDIIDLIPFCDIYVACSSTARLAIACAKPVVYYDIYRYTLGTTSISFGASKGTFVVLDNAHYAQALARLTSDRAQFDAVVAQQSFYAPLSGQLDGNSGRRIAGLLDQLCRPAR